MVRGKTHLGSFKEDKKSYGKRIELDNGYLWVSISHNHPCSNRWKEGEPDITCWLFKGDEFFDNQRVHNYKFKKYLDFKRFKDLLK